MLSDIVVLLDKIPLWKRLQSIPEEMDALKNRVAKLEAEIAQRPAPQSCLKCGKPTITITAIKPDPTFGRLGVQVKMLKCTDCKEEYTENMRP